MTDFDVATWMAGEVRKKAELHQEDAVDHIERSFGGEFTYENENGNLAIAKSVLKCFRAMTEADVIWEPRYKLWRLREPADDPGRKQA
jgi:hypothetical protein